MYFVAILWRTSVFLFVFSANVNQLLHYYGSVCLHEYDKLLFGVELFVAEKFSLFGSGVAICVFVLSYLLPT